jgi:hypothetical protein
MNDKEFAAVRKKLAKTQKKLAEILGVSIKAIHSYEQGWRTIPSHVERQLYFLMAHKEKSFEARKPCWTVKKCPTARKEQCPAWEFQAGKLCWFINGTLCECVRQSKWQDKMEFCQKCEVFSPLLGAGSIQQQHQVTHKC